MAPSIAQCYRNAVQISEAVKIAQEPSALGLRLCDEGLQLHVVRLRRVLQCLVRADQRHGPERRGGPGDVVRLLPHAGPVAVREERIDVVARLVQVVDEEGHERGPLLGRVGVQQHRPVDARQERRVGRVIAAARLVAVLPGQRQGRRGRIAGRLPGQRQGR